MSEHEKDLNDTLCELIESGKEVAPELARQWFRLQYAEQLGWTVRNLITAGAVVASVLGGVHLITARVFVLPYHLEQQRAGWNIAIERERREAEAKRPPIQRQSADVSGTASTAMTASRGILTIGSSTATSFGSRP